jgi:hypothetical protein
LSFLSLTPSPSTATPLPTTRQLDDDIEEEAEEESALDDDIEEEEKEESAPTDDDVPEEETTEPVRARAVAPAPYPIPFLLD